MTALAAPLALTVTLIERRDQLRDHVGDALYQQRIGAWITTIRELNKLSQGEALIDTALKAARLLASRCDSYGANWVFAALVEATEGEAA